jgi:hypothetical protein
VWTPGGPAEIFTITRPGLTCTIHPRPPGARAAAAGAATTASRPPMRPTLSPSTHSKDPHGPRPPRSPVGPADPGVGPTRPTQLQEEIRRRRAELIAAGRRGRPARRASPTANAAGRMSGGGTGRGGFDCSGLVQQSWRHAGVRLARDGQIAHPVHLFSPAVAGEKRRRDGVACAALTLHAAHRTDSGSGHPGNVPLRGAPCSRGTLEVSDRKGSRS